MQAQFTALMTVVRGESTMIETVFENRFQHLEEMRRMGLAPEIMRDTARIVGGQKLQGAEVMSTDLRASAALILTGLIASGETKVSKLEHLDRGYYLFHEKLVALGTNINLRRKMTMNDELKIYSETSWDCSLSNFLGAPCLCYWFSYWLWCDWWWR